MFVSKRSGEQAHERDAASPLVYVVDMSRNYIDIDDQACSEVMRRYRVETNEEAINFALRSLVGEAASLEEARALGGSGWEGDLDAIRAGMSAVLGEFGDAADSA